MLGSWIVVVYALLGSLVWNYVVRPHEEHDLEERFGAQYRAYRDAVRCWVPRLPAGVRGPSGRALPRARPRSSRSGADTLR
jgi:hypothetical protein